MTLAGSFGQAWCDMIGLWGLRPIGRAYQCDLGARVRETRTLIIMENIGSDFGHGHLCSPKLLA